MYGIVAQGRYQHVTAKGDFLPKGKHNAWSRCAVILLYVLYIGLTYTL